MARILKSPRAKADLAELWDFIAENSESRADAFIDVIEQKLKILAEHPNIGRMRPELLVDGLRSFPIGRYVVFYLPSKNGIDVVRILHGSRDLDTALDEEE